jgi:competence protein ComEC
MRRPLLWVLAFYGLGCLFGYVFTSLGRHLLWPLILAALYYLFAGHRLSWARWLVALLLIVLGLVRTSAVLEGPRQLTAFYSRQEMTLRGRVATSPVYTEDRARFTLAVEELIQDGTRWRGRGLLQVTAQMSPDQKPPAYGDELLLSAPLRSPQRAGNPGEFCYASYLLRRGIGGVVYVEEGDLTILTEGGGKVLVRWALALRDRFISLWREVLPPTQAEVLIAMATGQREDLSPEIELDFTRTGLGHLLAVSGVHVGLVGAFVLLLGRIFRLPQPLGQLLALGAIFFYVLAIGPRASAWRALFMVVGAIGGLLLHRRADGLNLWALAALILLFINPLQWGEVGFQLSFAATWALICLTSQLTGPLPAAMAASAAAQLGTWPLMVYHFQQLALAGLLANPLAIPLAGLILGMGLLLGFMGQVWLPAALPLSWCLVKLMDVFLWLARTLAKLPLYFEPAQPPALLVVGYYVLLVWVWKQERKLLPHNIGNGPIRRRKLAAVLLVLSLFLWARVIDLYRRELVVTFLDVGQGDAALLEFPGRVRVLIDGGGRPEHLAGDYDVGRDTLLPYFRRRGIKYLDVVICTHPHEDHFQGLIAALEEMPIGLVVDNGEAGPTVAYDRYYLLARQGNYLTGRAGLHLEPGISILHPPAVHLKGTTSDVNNNSIVCLVDYGQVSFLFTGDLDFEGQEYLLQQGSRLTADVLKYPHHGSRLAFNPSFLAAVSPLACVISVGANPFGQPSPAVLAFLAGAGVSTYRTDLDGAVRVVTNGRSFRVVPTRRNLLPKGERS